MCFGLLTYIPFLVTASNSIYSLKEYHDSGYPIEQGESSPMIVSTK